MAREISRLQCGHFRTQARIVQALAKLIHPASEGSISVLDCCCGTGDALAELTKVWNSPQNVKTFGIEIDRGRAEAAEKNLDEVLWAPIEHSRPSAGVSMMLANLPYDEVRGHGRLELELFKIVADWPARTGLLVLIVPKNIITENYSSLAMELESHYEVQPFNYPEPEAQEFGQCVLIGTRRVKDVKVWNTPAWTGMDWPTLPLDSKHPRFTLKPSAAVTLRRYELSDELIVDTLSRSPLRHELLRDALAPEPPLARPPLALRAGHLALMLAGGLCDTMVDDPVHGKFLVKGTLNVSSRKVRTDEKIVDGAKVAEIDIYRTKYELAVKCLRESGVVEAFTSEPDENPVEVDDGTV